MKRYKNITIFKKDTGGDTKKPTHDISVSVEGDYNDKAYAGSLWTKQGEKGAFLSGQFSKTREYNGKIYEGYVLVNEKELDNLLLKLANPNYPVEGIDTGIPDPSTIPF